MTISLFGLKSPSEYKPTRRFMHTNHLHRNLPSDPVVGLCVCTMWYNRGGKRPYLGCSCGRWVWTDRARKQVCHCGLPFNREDPKPGGQLTEQQQRLQREREQRSVEGSKVAALEAVLAKVVASMPLVEREQFEKDFPILRPKPKRGESDPFEKVSAEAAEAFREFKRLGNKKHNIEMRASRLQQQQDALSEELATTIADLEAAQYKHECISRSYAAVVQRGVEEGPQPDESFEHHPAWDRDSYISGMEEDQGATGAEGELRGGAPPQRTGRFAQQRGAAQRAATAAASAAAPESAGQQQQALAWPAHWDLQDPTFRSFSESLTAAQRAFLEYSWSPAVAAQQPAAAAAGATEAAQRAATAAEQQQQQQQQQLAAVSVEAAAPGAVA